MCQTLVTSREFRQQVLRVLVRLYETMDVQPNYLNMCQCLMFLDDADGVAAILNKLVKVGPGRYCSPRPRIPFDSRNEGLRGGG